ncbi:MAG: MG2 domain-containing protein [bacterium]|nr:MG2 domain-containing protein [bacterium]
MKKKVLSWWLFLLVLTVLIVSMGLSARENGQGDLKVLSASPEGGTESIQEIDAITVTFSKPMTALKALPEDSGEGPLLLTPPLTGKYRWLGTNTLCFQPRARLPLATRFIVTIPAGARSILGDSLPDTYTWTFETLRPEMERSSPYHNQSWVELDHPAVLYFNQKMNPHQAASYIELKEETSEKTRLFLTSSIRYADTSDLTEWETHIDTETVLVLKPARSLLKDCSYSLHLKEGLPALEGNLGLKQERVLKFETYKTFRYIGSREMKAHPPDSSLKFIFSNPVCIKDLVSHLKFNPEVKIPEEYFNYDYNYRSNELSLELDLLPMTQYTVTIDSGLIDAFGQTLKEEVIIPLETGHYSAYFRIPMGYGLMESYLPLYFPATLCNVFNVRQQMALLSPDEIVPCLIYQTESVPWDSTAQKWPGLENRSDTAFWKIDRLWPSNIPWDKRVVRPWDIGAVLGEKRHGTVFIQAHSKESSEGYLRTLLQVTELGLTGKFSPENNLIWVTRLKDESPVPDAYVEIRDEKNQILWAGKTDKEGLLQGPGWARLGLQRPKEYLEYWKWLRQYAIARQGEDTAFLSPNWGTGIYPWSFGIDYQNQPKEVEYQGYVFTERGLYRTGEEVHIKGIVRKLDEGKWVIHEGLPLLMEIEDSRGQSLGSDTIVLSVYGSFSKRLKLKDDAPSGGYTIYLSESQTGTEALPFEERKITITSSFRVEAYQPAEFEARVLADKDEYTLGDTFTATVKGWYLFGAPMAGDSVKYSAWLSSSTGFSPPGFPDFRFGSYQYRYEQSLSGSGLLDKTGKIVFKERLKTGRAGEPMSLNIEATVTSKGRRSFCDQTSKLVHPGEFYLGLARDSYFVDKADTLALKVVSVSPSGHIRAGDTIHLSVIREEWHSVREAGVGGRYFWKTHQVETEIFSTDLITTDTFSTVLVRPDQVGYYLIRASGKDQRGNEIHTDDWFYTVGEGYCGWERRDDDQIELEADAAKYKPGDVARILVKSPYEEATALVTLERELIMESKVVHLKGSTDLIEIPIEEDHIPNVYVSVVLIQGRKAFDKFSDENQDLGKPSFKMGYINLPVDPGNKRLRVALSTDRNEYRPGEEVEVRFKVEDQRGRPRHAEVTLAVVDVGVLNLIGYTTPDAFGDFYGNRPLSVATAESRIHVIGQRHYGEKGENRGGSGGFELFRTKFLATAYYKDSIYTDKRGTAAVRFKLPDNLTSFRVMATVHSKDSLFGSAEQRITVSKPLMMQSTLPRFSRQGDKFKAGVLLHNYAKRRAKITVEAKAENAEISETSLKTVELEHGECAEVTFSYLTKSVGKAAFSFIARLENETDALRVSIPVQLPRPTEAVAHFESITDSSAQQVIIPKDIYKGIGGISVWASSTGLADLEGSLRYLMAYPYLCLEQKISRILPIILAKEILLRFDLVNLTSEEMDNEVNQVLSRMKDFQDACGGFAYWPGGLISPYLTAYAAFTLVKAKEKGYGIDEEVLDKAKGYLQEYLRGQTFDWHYPYSIYPDLCIKSYICYVLSLAGKADQGTINLLYEKYDQIPLFGKAYLLKAIHREKMDTTMEENVARTLLNKIEVASTTAHFEEHKLEGMDWIHDSNVRTTAAILQSFIEAERDFPFKEKVIRWLVKERKAGRWRSTQENIYVFWALADYYQRYEKEEPNFEALIRLEGKAILQQIFKGYENRILSREADFEGFSQGKPIPLLVEKKGAGRLYYGVRMTYAPAQKLKAADEGMAMRKTVRSFDKGDTMGETYRAGEKYIVTLEVATSQERNFVVVDDPVPAGFEILNLEFQTESQEVKRQLRGNTAGASERWWGTFNHSEIYDDRMLVFADSLCEGRHIFSYIIKALTPGQFHAPATKVEEMYDPDVFGRTDEGMVKIK